MIKRVFVPLDGSGTSEKGLVQAIDLARGLKEPPHFVLMNLVERPMAFPEAGAAFDVEAIVESLREHGKTLLAKAVARCEAAGFSAESEIHEVQGRVADTVVDRARARGCDLIVMGTHGRRGPSRWVLGSDAELVARSSLVPVLLVREPGN